VRRIFGVNSSCYGQLEVLDAAGYAALRSFGIPLYLDVTSHVNLNDRPFWYCGVLNILEMGDCVLRTGWKDEEVKQACAKFDRVSQKLAQEGGGIISIFYHPASSCTGSSGMGSTSRGAIPWSEGNCRPPNHPKSRNRLKTLRRSLTTSPHAGVRGDGPEIPSLYPDRVYSAPDAQGRSGDCRGL
jgi:hypothetical protein